MRSEPLAALATVQLGCGACYSTAVIDVLCNLVFCTVHGLEIDVSVEEVQAWSRAHLRPTVTLA